MGKEENINMEEAIKEMEKEIDFLGGFFTIALVLFTIIFYIYIDDLEKTNEDIKERYNQVQEEKQYLLEQNLKLENEIKKMNQLQDNQTNNLDTRF